MVYLDPFEIVNQKVLPSFRKELVKILSKDFSRVELAKALDLTPVAIHYYLKGERGKNFKFNKQELQEIELIAKKFLETKDVFEIKVGFKRIVDSLFENRRMCNICGGTNCSCFYHR